MPTNSESAHTKDNWLTKPKQLRLKNCHGSDPFHHFTQNIHYNVIKHHENGDLTIQCDAGRACRLCPCSVSAPLGFSYATEGGQLQAYFNAVNTDRPFQEMIVVLADGLGSEAVLLASDTSREFINSIYPERIYDEPLKAGLHHVYLTWKIEPDIVDDCLERYPEVTRVSYQLPIQAFITMNILPP